MKTTDFKKRMKDLRTYLDENPDKSYIDFKYGNLVPLSYADGGKTEVPNEYSRKNLFTGQYIANGSLKNIHPEFEIMTGVVNKNEIFKIGRSLRNAMPAVLGNTKDITLAMSTHNLKTNWKSSSTDQEPKSESDIDWTSYFDNIDKYADGGLILRDKKSISKSGQAANNTYPGPVNAFTGKPILGGGVTEVYPEFMLVNSAKLALTGILPLIKDTLIDTGLGFGFDFTKKQNDKPNYRGKIKIPQLDWPGVNPF